MSIPRCGGAREKGRFLKHAPVDSSLFNEVPSREAPTTRIAVTIPPNETFLQQFLSSSSSQSKAMFATRGLTRASEER